MKRFTFSWQFPDFKACILKKLSTYAILFTLMATLSHGLNCTGDPCMYGICLEDVNSTYSCYCIDGYTGINCEINWDDCWSDPCQNGGTCNDAVAAYNCTCVDGFVGVNCEQKYSECSNHPCLNNGTCVDYDGFTCECPDGYSGDYCEIDISVCNDTICKNSGECVEGPGFSFFCRCPEGWAGRLCEQDIDECVASPCKNGGLCLNVPGSYTCACLFGYTGKDCDKEIVPCDENPCDNGAVCLLEDEKPICYCVPDYHGVLCELRYDDCESKFANCANGGTCIDGINSFSCACPAFYSGPYCEAYVLPSTTSSTSEMLFSFEPEKTTAATTSQRTISLPETSTSLFTLTSSTTQPPTSPGTTSPPYSRWYPFTETTVTNKNDSEVLSSTTTGSTQLFSVSRGTSHEALPSTESRSYTKPSFETSSTSTTMKTDMETSTQKSIEEEETTKDSVYQEVTTTTSVTIGSSLSEAPSFVTGYLPTSRYYPTATTLVQGTTNGMSMIEERSTTSITYLSSSSGTTEALQNKSSESSTAAAYPAKTTYPTMSTYLANTTQFSFTDKSTMLILPQTLVTESETSTLPFSSTSSISPISSTEKLGVVNETTYTLPEQSTTQVSTTSESLDCQGISCTTKATTVPVQNDPECNCTQRGDDCKIGSGITRAAFSGKSYARQQVDVSVVNGNNATLRVSTRIRTRFKSGIILHVFFDDQKYALVYLELSSLKFQFSCGLETMLLGEVDSPIDNGYEVDIDVRFRYFVKDEVNKCSARLLVNGTTAVSGEQILPPRGNLPHQANLHLGGIPVAFSHYFSHVTMGFVGCMSSLKVNDIPRHFIHDSIETFQIEDCVSFLCLSNPCQNFGACEEVNGTVRCRCIAGYTGPFCERSACDENPCALGATCISSPGTGFVCVCPLGTHGLLCEEDTVIVRPSFSVLVPGFSSYVAYGISTSIKDVMELKMRFIPRTIEQISLIAFLGQSGSRRDLSDHLSITYVRGYIMLTWDLGAGVRRIFTSVPITASPISTATKSYKAHTVRVGRRGQDAWLAVDGIGNVTGRVMGSMTRLDVSPILYIGGHKSKNFEALPHDLPLHTGFSGCIFDVELRTENTILPITSSSPATGRGVGECHRNECIRHSCKNGAVCLNHGATYSCVCTKDWMGSDCSTPVEFPTTRIAQLCHTIGE